MPTTSRGTAIDPLDRLREAQNEFYEGGSGAALARLLAPGITGTVPGDNRIAGTSALRAFGTMCHLTPRSND